MNMDYSDIPSDCVMFNLRRASRLVARRYEEVLRPLDLKAGQFSLLVALSLHPKTSLGPVADSLGMERTTLTRNLRPLLRRGLIESNPDVNDARVRLLSLTDDGRALLAQARPLWEKAQADSFNRLPSEMWPVTKRNLDALAS